MKIIFWNLKNIGATKLSRMLNSSVQAAGYGTSVLDYIVKVVMGDAIWATQKVNPALPADVFVIIELKSGGKKKGKPAFGTAYPTIAAITAAMNAVAAATPSNKSRVYASTGGLIVGHHETVGIIYDSNQFTVGPNTCLRDNANNFIRPRTPLMSTLLATNGQVLQIVGIHAPPPKGAAAVRFAPPINFCTQLSNCPLLVAGGGATYVIGGDFNCCPTDTWISNGNAVLPFTNLNVVGYTTALPTPALSSTREKVINKGIAQSDYLSGAYDNQFYLSPSNVVTSEHVLDLIGTMNISNVGIRAALHNYRSVSDHLPVAMVI